MLSSNNSINLILPSLVSSVFEITVTQPLDVIKTYKQANKLNELNYSIKNLYKGFIPRAIGNIPSRTIFLFTQDYFKYHLADNNYKSLIVPLMSGFCQTLVDTPVEVMKINQIFNIKNKNYYSGFLPHCTRNIIFVGFVFNFKEYGKKYDSISIMAMYGAAGGLLGSYVSHPFDTIKTIKQSQINNNIQLKDYMRGSHLRASMGFINMFVSLSFFELFKLFL
jgi:hypothetical protein